MNCKKDKLQEQLLQSSFHSDQYNVSGRWVEDENGLAIEFEYNGKTVILPFPVYVSEQTMPWLPVAGVMRMEGYIEDEQFKEMSRKALEKVGMGSWDEWE